MNISELKEGDRVNIGGKPSVIISLDTYGAIYKPLTQWERLKLWITNAKTSDT